MDVSGADHPDLKFLEQAVEGFGLHIQSAGVAAEGRHDHPAGIGNETTATDAVSPRFHGRCGMQVSGNLEHAQLQ